MMTEEVTLLELSLFWAIVLTPVTSLFDSVIINNNDWWQNHYCSLYPLRVEFSLCVCNPSGLFSYSCLTFFPFRDETHFPLFLGFPDYDLCIWFLKIIFPSLLTLVFLVGVLTLEIISSLGRKYSFIVSWVSGSSLCNIRIIVTIYLISWGTLVVRFHCPGSCSRRIQRYRNKSLWQRLNFFGW